MILLEYPDGKLQIISIEESRVFRAAAKTTHTETRLLVADKHMVIHCDHCALPNFWNALACNMCGQAIKPTQPANPYKGDADVLNAPWFDESTGSYKGG